MKVHNITSRCGSFSISFALDVTFEKAKSEVAIRSFTVLPTRKRRDVACIVDRHFGDVLRVINEREDRRSLQFPFGRLPQPNLILNYQGEFR